MTLIAVIAHQLIVAVAVAPVQFAQDIVICGAVVYHAPQEMTLIELTIHHVTVAIA
jgi:hypothetical protein